MAVNNVIYILTFGVDIFSLSRTKNGGIVFTVTNCSANVVICSGFGNS